MVVIALLRGINVGGRNLIGMSDLRNVFDTLGLAKSKTHLQSGNVLAVVPAKTDLVALSARIETALEKFFKFRPAVILRTADELRSVVAGNPFAGRPDVHPGKLLVTFLSADPGDQARTTVQNLPVAPEELHIDGREYYVYYPDGAGRSKLSIPKIDRILKTPGTARNWNTVTKLLELADALASNGV